MYAGCDGKRRRISVRVKIILLTTGSGWKIIHEHFNILKKFQFQLYENLNILCVIFYAYKKIKFLNFTNVKF